VVDFRHSIIIMTSNLGSDIILEKGVNEDTRSLLDERLKGAFKPEFLNRVDETIVFESLGREQIRSILDILVSQLGERLEEKRMSLELSDAAKDLIAERGYDPAFGARPLRRAIRDLVENPLAKQLLAGDFVDGDTVFGDIAPDGSGGKKIVFTKG
jgi:ATP-dependent Clp protease ATP-binding subunit ClpB